MLGALTLTAAAQVPSPTLKTKVEPNWADLTSGYLLDQALVNLTLLPSGLPFALSAANGSLPDPVVQALAQWRFTPYKKIHHEEDLTVALRVPVRRQLNPDLEIAQRPRWSLTNDLRPAFVRAATLNAESADELLKNLPRGEAPDHFRTSLLLYYIYKGATDAAKARQVRRDLLLWLVHTYPQDGILLSPNVTVNASGEPLADSEGVSLLKQAWLSAVHDYPDDLSVAVGAATFFKTVDPVAALRIVATLKNWDMQSNMLGEIYALGGLGVNALAPGSGAALATSSQTLTDSGLPASFRKALLDSDDLKLVLSGAVATIEISRQLSAHKALPTGYADYCRALMDHLHQLYPQTSLRCLPPDPPLTRYIAASVARSNLLKQVTPLYPPEAKKQHLQAAVTFQAIIDPQGHVQQLELLRGPFVLYSAARTAILQWQYKPVLANGVPLRVSTEISVEFAPKQ